MRIQSNYYTLNWNLGKLTKLNSFGVPAENHVNQILIYFNRARIDRMQLQTCHFIVNENQIEASSKCAREIMYGA